MNSNVTSLLLSWINNIIWDLFTKKIIIDSVFNDILIEKKFKYIKFGILLFTYFINNSAFWYCMSFGIFFFYNWDDERYIKFNGWNVSSYIKE